MLYGLLSCYTMWKFYSYLFDDIFFLLSPAAGASIASSRWAGSPVPKGGGRNVPSTEGWDRALSAVRRLGSLRDVVSSGSTRWSEDQVWAFCRGEVARILSNLLESWDWYSLIWDNQVCSNLDLRLPSSGWEHLKKKKKKKKTSRRLHSGRSHCVVSWISIVQSIYFSCLCLARRWCLDDY